MQNKALGQDQTNNNSDLSTNTMIQRPDSQKNSFSQFTINPKNHPQDN